MPKHGTNLISRARANTHVHAAYLTYHVNMRDVATSCHMMSAAYKCRFDQRDLRSGKTVQGRIRCTSWQKPDGTSERRRLCLGGTRWIGKHSAISCRSAQDSSHLIYACLALRTHDPLRAQFETIRSVPALAGAQLTAKKSVFMQSRSFAVLVLFKVVLGERPSDPILLVRRLVTRNVLDTTKTLRLLTTCGGRVSRYRLSLNARRNI